MAAAVSITLHLTCSICLDVFKEPKTLPCLHTFCESCLKGHICATKIYVDERGKHFECPLCRAKTFVQTTSDKTAWAKDFPTNHFIVSLMDDGILKLRDASNDQRNNKPKCTPCGLDDKQAKAFCFCIDCREHFCKNCYEDHRKFKITRDHKLLKGNDLPMESSVFEKLSQISICEVHAGKELEFHCTKHDKFLCSICATRSHQKCREILHIADIAKDKGVDFQEYLRCTSSIQQEVKELLQTKLTEADKLSSYAADVENCSSKLKFQLRDLLHKLDTTIKAEFEPQVNSSKERLMLDVAELLGVMERLREANEVIHLSIAYGSDVQKEVMCDWIKKEKNNIENIVLSKKKLSMQFLEECAKNGITWTEDIVQHEIKELLESVSLFIHNTTALSSISSQMVDTNLGYPTAHSKKNENSVATQTEIDDQSWPNSDTSTQCSEKRSTFLERTIQKAAEYDILVPRGAGEACIHNGSLILKDGNLVFIDRKNKILKVVRKDFEVKCFQTLSNRPLDVCLLKRKKAVVAVASPKSINVFEIGENIEETGSFGLRDVICSLCYVGADLAILLRKTVDGTDNYYIQFRDGEFRLIKTIDIFTAFARQIYLSNVKLIRSRYNNEIIIVTPTKIFSFDRLGNQKWYFISSDLLHANYISFDIHNNIYVSDLEMGMVHQISASCYKENRILLTDIDRPTSLVYNSKDNSLVVGCFDKIHVYRFN